jgi:NAD(P)-dependent dehydrogenase (short-subunit alcohol dehydrogenase family)
MEQQKRVALITGASHGLGREIATLLARQGMNLVLTARGREQLEEMAGSLRRYDSTAVAIAGDVSKAEHRRRLVEGAEALGRLDLLVNNASTLGAAPLPPLTKYPLADLLQVFQTNVIAPLGLVQEALELLKRSNGLVVNISSDAAIGGYPGWGGYGASKAALDLVTLTLANELRNEGIGIVSVDPGDMRTQMQQEASPGEDISDSPLPEVTVPFWAWLLAQEPLAVTGRRYRAQSDLWEVTYEDQRPAVLKA